MKASTAMTLVGWAALAASFFAPTAEEHWFLLLLAVLTFVRADIAELREKK
jgi:hypothetical protein